MSPERIPDAPARREAESRARGRTACVFCNGELGDPVAARSIVAASDLVVAADGGAKHVAALGLEPHAIVGDMDSMGTDLPWNGEAVTRHSFPKDKNESDAELAMEFALASGCQRVVLLAAVGRRLDHSLGNVALVASHPGIVEIHDGACRLLAIDRFTRCRLEGPLGATVSLLTWGAAVARVTSRGLRFPLHDEPLVNPTRGLSNVLSEEAASIEVSSGVLLVGIYEPARSITPASEVPETEVEK